MTKKQKFTMEQEIRTSTKIMMLMVLIIFVFSATTILTINNEFKYTVAKYLNKQSTEYAKDDVVQSLAKVCGMYPTDINKVYCVTDFVVESGAFKYSNESRRVVDTQELLEHGGDCKSWTTFYDSVFKTIGLKTSFVTTDTHVFLNVYNNDFYCNVDQTNVECAYND